MADKHEAVESKLIPILREGVEVVKMILFLRLKEHLAVTKTEWTQEYRSKMIGAVINDIFGIINPEKNFLDFAQENQEQIRQVINEIPTLLDDLCIPITDALRVMILCDHQEGVDNSNILAESQEKGVLLVDRDLPMPNKFIELVRRLAGHYGLYQAPVGEES